MYPNPALNKVNVVYALDKDALVSIDITDVAGNIILKDSGVRSGGKHEQIFDISNLDKGVYFVQISINESKRVLKLIKD